eukprot:g32396.t2
MMRRGALTTHLGDVRRAAHIYVAKVGSHRPEVHTVYAETSRILVAAYEIEGLELAAKLSPKRLPEIRDRALKALGSKLELGILPPEALHRSPQPDSGDSEPELLNVALKLLGRLAHGQDTTRLHEAGCIPFLQDFRPQVPPPCLETLDAALWALLCHRPEAAEKEGSGDAFSTPLKRRKDGGAEAGALHYGPYPREERFEDQFAFIGDLEAARAPNR